MWGIKKDGTYAILDSKVQVREPLPTIAELEGVANELKRIATDLNEARKKGFLCEALKQSA